MRFSTLALLVALGTTAGAQRPAPRRVPLTPELERTAFADAEARTLLTRARAARVAQDSALRAYDARTYQRFTIGVGVRAGGPERLLMRHEQSARVRWARGAGLWVEPTGRRTAFPMGHASLDMTNATPIPYFPGRETLWLPGEARVAQAEVNENDFLHPLAAGAEAYYRYAVGDSMSIRLPDGGRIALRELRITARRPDYRAFVGSFWFDVDRGSLVRAAYRLAAEADLWQGIWDDYRRQLSDLDRRARTDTGAAARAARKSLDSLRMGLREKLGVKFLESSLTPMRTTLSGITVEYGLYEGRFWLPKVNVAEGQMLAGFLRVPARFEESYRYDRVNVVDSLPPVPAAGELGITAEDTLYVTSGMVGFAAKIPGVTMRSDTSTATAAQRQDGLLRRYAREADSLGRAADSLRAKGDSARARGLAARAAYAGARARQIERRRAACARGDSSYLAGVTTRYEGALRMAVRLPCDTTTLATSPDLPGSIYDPNEALFGTSERDALLDALGMGLQPGWGPRAPTVLAGLGQMRYNRVEGLSLGASASSALGLGYTARAEAHFGLADKVPNGELSLARANGRAEVRLGVFKRLAVANDERGAPLSLGASIGNLLFARDEGFYYRAEGVELAGTRAAPNAPALSWRLFAERQRSAGRDPRTQASLGNLIGDARFVGNVEAERLTAYGVAAEVARTFGADPRGTQLDTRVRAEATLTDRRAPFGGASYGRVSAEGTLRRAFGEYGLSLTGAAGTSSGDVPPQRAFYVGGLQTVRGQFARPEGVGRVGDAYWLARTEVALGRYTFARPSLFYDAGWAGGRGDLLRRGRPLTGAGAGLSLFDNIVRLDLARGIWPETRWRGDVYLGVRF